MSSKSLDYSRASLALLALYLSKAEARDKICRAIQYGSKFISGGAPGVANDVDKSTSLARKVFRLLKSVNELQNLLSPAPKDTPLSLVLLGRMKSAMMATFLALDQVVWLGRSGIYKNKETTDLCSKLSLYSWMGGCVTTGIIEICELARLSHKIEKITRDLRQKGRSLGAEDEAELKEKQLAAVLKSRDRQLSFVKSALDVVVAIGLLQLSPHTVSPRVTGGIGFITSLISCYQLLPAPPKAKTS